MLVDCTCENDGVHLEVQQMNGFSSRRVLAHGFLDANAQKAAIGAAA